MPIVVGGKKIIPAPLVTITKNYEKSNSDEKLGVTYNIVLNGTLVAYKGSPNSTGVFWTASDYPPDETIDFNDRLRALLRKRQALDCLFTTDGQLLEIYPLNGSSPMKANPKVNNIEWQEGLWFDQMKYTVNMTADQISTVNAPICESGIFSPAIKSSSEEWQIEENDNTPSYRLTHIVSAQGKITYDPLGVATSGWIHAKNWVQPRLGLDLSKITDNGAMDLPSYYGGYNYGRSHRQNEIDGNYEVTESWILASGSYLEDFTVDTRTDDTGRTTVTVNGTITGLDTKDNNAWSSIPSVHKYTAANAGFTIVAANIFSRAQNYGGIPLNPQSIGSSIGKNPITGVITYNAEYNNRPSTITGALSESIQIVDQNQADVFAIIPVIGRMAGPVLQSLSATTEKRRSINIELVQVARKYGEGPLSFIDTDSIIATYVPNFSYVRYLEKDEETFDIITGRQSRNVSYVYE